MEIDCNWNRNRVCLFKLLSSSEKKTLFLTKKVIPRTSLSILGLPLATADFIFRAHKGKQLRDE